MFLQEVNNHENIIRCHLLFPQTDSGTQSKLLSIDCTLGRLLNVLKAENDRDIYLIFEYMETDLHAVIRANILEEIHKQYIMYQLFKALKYMHSAELLHRDIKVSGRVLCPHRHASMRHSLFDSRAIYCSTVSVKLRSPTLALLDPWRRYPKSRAQTQF